MKKYDVVYPVNYTVNGEEKTRWLNCGAVIQTKNGHALKLDSIPVGVGTDGLWFRLFEPEAKNAKPKPQSDGYRESEVPF